MYWFRTASKVLVWLLAASVPLQGLCSVACRCTAEAKQTTDAHRAPGQHAPGQHAKCRCCCRQPASWSTEAPAATHACCRATPDVKRTSCSCSMDCQCKKGDSYPRPKQIPPEHRTESTDQATGPLVIFCLECGDPEVMETEGRTVTSLSGADRCILLCRFHL